MKPVGNDVTPLPDSGGKYVFEFADQMLIKKQPLFTEIKAIKENSFLHLINVLMNIRIEFLDTKNFRNREEIDIFARYMKR